MNYTFKKDSLTNALQNILSDGFVAFTGAGLSIPAPCCAPSWWTLTEELIHTFFSKVPDDWGVPKELIIKDTDIKPELVLENFANFLDLRLYKVFQTLDVNQPNENHKMIAKLAKMGILKACITTNFDVYLERALKQEKVDYILLVDNREYETYSKSPKSNKFLLCKIHGTIERPDTIVSVASAYKSSKGFSYSKANIITSLLERYPFLFLGYSGWDFEHSNYRRYWDRVGPNVKQIIWNRRPNEDGGPDFEKIFDRCKDKVLFTSAELPGDLVESLKLINKKWVKGLNKTPLTPEKNAKYFELAKTKRLDYMNEWFQTIPMPFKIGLVMTQGNQFSENYKKNIKNSTEDSQNKESLTYKHGEITQELSRKFAAQEITVEEYQQQMQTTMIDLQLQNIRKEHHKQILLDIEGNKFPGVTDNSSYLLTWLGNVGQLLRSYSLDEAEKIACDHQQKLNSIILKGDARSQAEYVQISYKIMMMHKTDQLWVEYYQKMEDSLEKFGNDEISRKKHDENIAAIFNEFNNTKVGMTVDVMMLFRKLVEQVQNLKKKTDFIEGCEAIFLTVNIMAIYITSDMIQDPEYLKIYSRITSSIQEKNMVSQQDLIDFEKPMREIFNPLLERINSKKSLKIARFYLEGSLLSIWLALTQYMDPIQSKNYQKRWDNAEYPLRKTHKDIYYYFKPKVMEWLSDAESLLPHRLLHIIYANLTRFGESGNDIKMVKHAAEQSIALTDGLITEATPIEIPSVLAAMYEELGDQQNALKYYNLSIDAVLNAIPPLWQDAILYRIVLMKKKEDSVEAKQSILTLVENVHPNFKGKYPIINHPGRDLVIQEASNIAKDLGYSSLEEAFSS